MGWDKIILTKQYELVCQRAQSTKKYIFSKTKWWPKSPIFSQNCHFLPLNGRQDRQDFAQSCPRGWQRLTRKISNCGTKLTNVVLKVWDNIWDCGGYTPPNTHFAEVICRGNHQKITKNHQKHQKTPKTTSNTHQPTNMYHQYDF